MKQLFLLLLLAASASGDEHPVKKSSFTISEKLKGLYLPVTKQEIALAPKQWKTFTLVNAPTHGSLLKKGEAIMTFKTEDYEDWMLNLSDDVKSKELQLAIANRELTELKQKNELSLARAKEALDNAESDLDYFLKIGLATRQKELAFRLKQSELYVSYQQEELDQLQKMYEEDDLTEETEEIILVRQKSAVESAQFSLESTKLDNARTLEAELPRQQSTLEKKATESQIFYATAKANLSRQYALKEIEVAKAERVLEKARKTLKEAEGDRALFTITAAEDSRVYFGEFKDGTWQKGETTKFLRVGGSLPIEVTFLTLVPINAPLALNTLVNSETASKLSTLNSTTTPAPIASIADWPNLEGKHLVTLPPAEAKPFLFPTNEGETEVIFYQAKAAIAVPKTTLQKREDGTQFVRIKLSEGEPEERTVEVGKENGELVEIIKGLEEGQVILH